MSGVRLILGLLMIATAASSCRTVDPSPEVSPRLVTLGDSITDGGTLALLLRQSLREAGEPVPVVINAGVGGDTCAGMLARLREDVISYRPDIVTISCGINDSDRGITAADFERDLRRMVDQLQDENIEVILMTTSIVGPKREEHYEILAAYNECIRRVAQDKTCGVAPVFGRMADHPGGYQAQLSGDHTHFEFPGYRTMTRAVLDALGHETVPVPEAMAPQLFPGIPEAWYLYPVGADAPGLTAAQASALAPGEDWVRVPLPQPPRPDIGFWPNQIRAEGYVTGPTGLVKSPRFLALAEYRADHERQGWVQVGGTPAVVWFNGREVYREDPKKVWKGFRAGRVRIPVVVRPGVNQLVYEHHGDFFGALTDERIWEGELAR